MNFWCWESLGPSQPQEVLDTLSVAYSLFNRVACNPRGGSRAVAGRGSRAATPASEDEFSSPEPRCRNRRSASPVAARSRRRRSPSVEEIRPRARRAPPPRLVHVRPTVMTVWAASSTFLHVSRRRKGFLGLAPTVRVPFGMT